MKKVLIIGAGFLQDFVIQKAKSMGYTTLAVDMDPNAIGFQHADKYQVINIVDEAACLAYAQQESIDGVLTAATDYGVLTASYIAREMGLPGLDYDVAKLIKNKYLVRKCLYNNQVDDASEAYLIDSTTNIDDIKDLIRYPVMVKPCDGSGSRGACRVESAEQLSRACQIAMESSILHKAEVETFISGAEYGVESLVVDGEVHVLGIMKKWMTEPPYYAELGHAIPSGLDEMTEERVRQTVIKAIKALGINSGSVNMDLLMDSEGKVYIVDIGARMGGNMIGPCIIPYATGMDYMANMIRVAVGEPVDLMQGKKCAVATRLLAFQRGVVKKIPDIYDIEKKYDVEIFHHMHEGASVNEYRTNLDGCGYIIAKGSHMDNVLDRVETSLEFIKKEAF